MIIGYIRVSTKHQSTLSQETALKDYKCERVFTDFGVSGKNTEREQLKQMLSFIREGDTLVCFSLSRLGRSLSDLINIVNTLQQRQVKIIFIKENLILDESPHNKLIFNIFSCLAEYEREQKLELIEAGIKASKEKGTVFGRPKKMDADKEKLFKELCREVDNGKLRPCDVYHDQRLGISKATYYRLREQQ